MSSYIEASKIASQALFGRPSAALQEYSRKEDSRKMNNILNPYFRELTINAYNSYQYGDVYRKVEAMRSVTNEIWKGNSIRMLHYIDEFQTISDEQRRWIMSNVKLRKMYHSGRVEGYGSDYIDNAPGRSGVNHYDHLYVTAGIVRKKEGSEKTWVRDICSTVREDYDLAMTDKLKISLNMRMMEQLLESEIDPTSETNGIIG